MSDFDVLRGHTPFSDSCAKTKNLENRNSNFLILQNIYL